MNPGLLSLLRLRWISSTSVVSLVSFSLLLFFTRPALSGLPEPDECAPKSCGEGRPDIKYPFWLGGGENARRSLECGPPAFELTCNPDSGYPVLLKHDNFVVRNKSGYPVLPKYNDLVVRNISYENQTFLVSNPGVSGSECPLPRYNLSLAAFSPFAIDPRNLELVFLLNCTEKIRNSIEMTGCAAGVNRTRRSFVGEHPTVPYTWESCESVVVARYLENLHERYWLLLKWTATSCSECAQTGGRCRYDNDQARFMCLCSDRLHQIRCNNSGTPSLLAPGKSPTLRSGINFKVKILIGVGAAALGFLIAVTCFALWYRRKKIRERSNSSNFLDGSTTSDLSFKQDPESGSTHSYPIHVFSFKELEEATNGFDASKELGDGGFGTVYKGKLHDGRIVAVKRLYENNYKRVEQFLNEVAILHRLRHPNLVTLYGCTSRHSRELLLVYEYVPNGTVADHLHGARASEGALTWPIRMSIAIETATALAYLHAVEPQIIHRDVKTNNILLDSIFHVKVADFGLSRLFPMDVTHVSTAPQGTPGYVDPEYHQCYQLTDKSDVYSFGVVLVELISSKPAVDITRHRYEINLSNMAINKIQNGALHELVDPGLGFDSDWEVRTMITLVGELAFRCLQGEKEMRPSMEEVLEVLRGIEDGCYKVEKPEDPEATPKDDTRLLKSVRPVSPDSVTDKWTSRSTTPHTSA